VVIDPAPLDLVIDGSRLHLRRGEVSRFAGEALVDAELPEGATRDLGLMIRRGVASGSMMVVSSGVATGRILVAIEESVVDVIGESVVLETGDALVGDRNEQVEIVSGLICALEITS
jgi:environmental stress-induced protein Ves